jgi:hypothetical protein
MPNRHHVVVTLSFYLKTETMPESRTGDKD